MGCRLGRAGPLADQWCGSLCQIHGDWAFFCEVFYFPQWSAAEEMCWMCGASSVHPHLLWCDHRENAGWRHTRRTHETYMHHLTTSGRVVPALFAVACGVIGLRLECCMINVLHAVDQGVSAHIIGNVLWIAAVIRGVYGGTNMKDKVSNLNKAVREWYKTTRCKNRLKGTITLERLRANGAAWPKLKGHAAGIRHLMPYALAVAVAMSDGSDHDRCIILICRMMVRFYDILTSKSQFLSPRAIWELPLIGQLVAD